jgi:hypothetical protein
VQIHGIKRFGVSVLVALGLVTTVYPGAAPTNVWAAPSTVTTINPRAPRVLFHAEDSTVVLLAQAGAASLWLDGQRAQVAQRCTDTARLAGFQNSQVTGTWGLYLTTAYVRVFGIWLAVPAVRAAYSLDCHGGYAISIAA